ncbi:hypothetical protein [Asaia sp. VD9]|uniref:hypothetical protein n=1 Tax=Asaia sp. VD9 TaxID=3081235 RepID=UPI00301A3353
MTSRDDVSLSDAEMRLKTLRHDLRNDLATALLAADMLSTSKDETVRRHATAIISALDKATERLKRSKQGG